MKFQENPHNGGRERDEKEICSPSKVPLIIGRSQPNLQFVAVSWKLRGLSLKKITPKEAVIQTRREFI